MSILHIFSKYRRNNEPIETTINRIKNGETLLKDELINKYKPYIIKVVSKTTGKYVELENSDEYSIGLIAFNEAIESFDPDKSPNFLSFAELVIKRRVIDYTRKNYKNSNDIPLTYFETSDDSDKNQFEEKYFKIDASSLFDNIEVKEEIDTFKKRLKEFKIELGDLVTSAPKHLDSKRLAIKIARIIAENKELSDKLEHKKNMPAVDIMKHIKVNHKTIERNRKFIIAVYLIINSRLEVLQSYVQNIEKGGNEHE